MLFKSCWHSYFTKSVMNNAKLKKVNPAFDKRHLKEYLYYGLAAGILFSLPTWYYLHEADSRNGWVIYCGTILFMFVIMRYVMTLTRRRTDYKSTWVMITAGHMAVLAGIVVAVLLCLSLCFIYIPGFFTGASDSSFLENARPEFNRHNEGTIFQIFFPATLLNFGVGGFMTIVVSYALKLNQTKDRAAPF